MPATVSITRPAFVDTDTLSASAFNAVAVSSITVPDAESAELGVIKLAGDLGGPAAAPIVLKGSFTNGELKVRDVGGDFFLAVATGSTLTTNRTLTVTTGDADRTITLSGNPTLNDWFDQGVKTTSSPTFATVYATSASGTVQFFAGDQEETGERAQLYAVSDTYSALNLYSKNNKLVVQIDTLGESNTSGRVNVGDAAGIWGSLSVNGSQGLLTLYAVGNTVTLSGAGLDACPVGLTTAAAAKFTTVYTSDNVGIGTETATQRLQVNGNVKLSTLGQYYGTDNYTRYWTPGQSIGAQSNVGNYGATITYLAYFDSTWKQISAGIACNLAIVEGKMVYSTGGAGSQGDTITWSDKFVITPTTARIDGFVAIGREPAENFGLVVQAPNSANFALSVVESTGAAAINLRPNVAGQGVNFITSDLFSGSTLLPLALSGRGAITDFVLDTNGSASIGVALSSKLSAAKLYIKDDFASTYGGIYLESTAAAGNSSMIGFSVDSALVGNIISTTTATSYNTSSDRRLKTNIRDYTASASGAVIDAIQPRLFDWKSGQKDSIGCIAQELHQVAPYAVTKGDADPDTIHQQWQVDYSKLVPVIIAEVKSLRARVSTLEALTNP